MSVSTLLPEDARPSRAGRERLPWPMLAAALVVTLIMLLPLLFVAYATLEVGIAEAIRLIVRPRVGELLWNTARLAIGCMLASAVLGTVAAWLVERSNLPLRRVFNVLLVAPLAIPAFVNSYGWVSLMPSAAGFGGALVIVTLSYFPFVYLPVAASLRGLDPAHEEAARSLGHGALRTFTRTVLPQLRPAILGGALLVGLHILAEFGALQMLRYPTFTTAIYDQYQSTFNGAAANMLAGVLVLCCLVLLVTELRLRGRARYARTGSGTARPIDRIRLGGLTVPAVGGLVLLCGLALGVPLASLGYWLAVGSSSTVDTELLLTSTGTSLGLGALGAVVTTVAALPVAWLYVRRRGRVSTLLERATYTGSALPGIVIALALVTIAVRVTPSLYQTTSLVIVAYLILFLPRAVVNVRATLAQTPPVLDDVAQSLGAGRLGTLARVTLPLIAPGLGAGAALVFLGVVTELTATLLLAPTGTQTLATQFWSYSDNVAYGEAAPYAALMVLISAPATYLLTRAVRKESGRD
ncbi:iron ABC transporter permease [Actinophytocola sp.]|uniref:ABC transporter permease n=1 Tax=Actinophytocola sp. TaxID=1872138 RepID=UPI002D7E23DD|nr:iron ABC transporter permease [Actinophytocola sp.]HET9142066.1 iron ABC transporter permease [Actinophytocola sp.]